MTAAGPVPERTGSDGATADRRPRRIRQAFDVVTVTVLLFVAYLARRGTLPTDGLWFDDSWVAAGAVIGTPRALLSVGSGHPGFTALLMAIDRIGGGDLRLLGVPSLVAGVVTPAVLYLVLRRLRTGRAVAALVSSALTVAWVPVLYAGRVKGYTLDTLGVLLLAAALPPLARRTWRWPLALIWVLGAVGVGLLSGYMLVATAAAGLVLVLHPRGDRLVRGVALGAQAAIQGIYYLLARTRTDLAGIEEVMEVSYDGHLTFSWNPIELGKESVRHLGRVAEVYPGGSGRWAMVLGLVAVVGLVCAATRGRTRAEGIVGRFLLLLVAGAWVGGFLDLFPFGPTNGQISAGGRHTLWLVPAMAVGTAAALGRIRDLVRSRRMARLAFDATCVAAAVVVMVSGYQPAEPAPFQGCGSATAYIDDTLAPGDVVVLGGAMYCFAVSTDIPSTAVATPDHQIGFAPAFADPRIQPTGGWAPGAPAPADLRDTLAHADRVLIHDSGPLSGVDGSFRPVLEEEGFTLEDQIWFEWNLVSVWVRP